MISWKLRRYLAKERLYEDILGDENTDGGESDADKLYVKAENIWIQKD